MDSTLKQVTSNFIFIAIALVIIIQQNALFRGREYRIDEVWRVHSVIGLTPVEVMRHMTDEVHPPGYRIQLAVWIALTGQHPDTARYLSALTFLLALSFLFRLSADLFGRETALWAVLLVFTMPLIFFYTHDVGLYPFYVMISLATWFFFMRWIRSRRFHYALAYVAVGIIGVYSYYLVIFTIITQWVTIIVFAKWDFKTIAFGTWLCAAIGLAFALGWGPVLTRRLMVEDGSVRLYFSWDTEWTIPAFAELIRAMLIPGAFVLGIAAPFLPNNQPGAQSNRFRFGRYWQASLIAFALAFGFLLAAWVNQYTNVVTPRNLLQFLPLLAILLAVVIQSWHGQVQVILMILLTVQVATHDFDDRAYGRRMGADEVAQIISETMIADSVIVLETPIHRWSPNLPFSYQFQEQLPFKKSPDDILIVANRRGSSVETYLNFPQQVITSGSDSNLQTLSDFIDDVSQVWYVVVDDVAYEDKLEDVFLRSHVQYSETETDYGYRVVEYRHVIGQLPDERDRLTINVGH